MRWPRFINNVHKRGSPVFKLGSNTRVKFRFWWLENKQERRSRHELFLWLLHLPTIWLITMRGGVDRCRIWIMVMVLTWFSSFPRLNASNTATSGLTVCPPSFQAEDRGICSFFLSTTSSLPPSPTTPDQTKAKSVQLKEKYTNDHPKEFGKLWTSRASIVYRGAKTFIIILLSSREG